MVEILLMMKRSTWRWETIKIRPFQPKQKGSDLTLLIPELESENQTESTPTTPTSSSSSRLDSDSTSEASYLPCHCCQNSKDKKAEISSKLISNSASSSLNWKLMLLLTIASAALASILIISHQVGTRKHLHQYQSLPKLKKLWKSEANTDLFNFPSSPYMVSVSILVMLIFFQLITRHLSTSERGVRLSLTIPESGWRSNQGRQNQDHSYDHNEHHNMINWLSWLSWSCF